MCGDACSGHGVHALLIYHEEIACIWTKIITQLGNLSLQKYFFTSALLLNSNFCWQSCVTKFHKLLYIFISNDEVQCFIFLNGLLHVTSRIHTTYAHWMQVLTNSSDTSKGDSDLSVHRERERGNQTHFSIVSNVFQCTVSGPLKTDSIHYSKGYRTTTGSAAPTTCWSVQYSCAHKSWQTATYCRAHVQFHAHSSEQHCVLVDSMRWH